VRLRRKKKNQIVIDRQAGLVFDTENELFEHFNPQIEFLENEYDRIAPKDEGFEPNLDDSKILDLTLEEPAEIWHDDKTFKKFPIFHFIRPVESLEAFHVAVTYVSSEDEPTFIFFHFLTRSPELLNKYRRGDLVYDRAFEQVGFAALEGDALSESDPLAMGLFLAMLKIRADKDVPYERFLELGQELREDTIQEPDEIWRSSDMNGNVLVTFVKEFPDHTEKDLHYIAVTQEDANSRVHALLFSFPTNDASLVERYRHGENLQADEVVQESSH
jgi:hypothetical protein